MIYQQFERTRLAPTPSGYLHLGNVLSFVLTSGLAQKHGARVLLRIDDMDRERVREAYVQDIFDTLHFLEIPWDEGPRDLRDFDQSFSQLHRMQRYRDALNHLAEAGHVFGCNCSRQSLSTDHSASGYPGTCLDKYLPLDGAGIQWRLRTEDCREVSFIDLVQGNRFDALPASVRFAVVRRKDQKPAYQLCSLLDDLHYKVDLVVRGEDLYASSLLQCFLSGLLPENHFRNTVFHHHPLVKQAGLKMSKSEGSTSIHYLRGQGMNRADVYRQVSLTAGLEPLATDRESLFALLEHHWKPG